MTICENLKDKIIIIVESDKSLAKEIEVFLKKQGFIDVRLARDGNGIYEIIRPYYSEPNQVGLIIANENLPDCQVMEICKTLSSNDDGTYIPFVILTEHINKEKSRYIESNHFVTLPINYSELLIIIGFQLVMKHERFLRHKQENQLNNELAERKLVDAKLKYLVAHDELTGLLNRQNFEQQLPQVLNRCHMLEQNSALLFIDIDRFCLINEIEGFETGDRMLVEVVAIIRRLVDSHDLFARIGSDEFCLFFENKTLDTIKQIAEIIRQTVYEYRFFTGDICYNISLSIGIYFLNHSAAVIHPNEIISRSRRACSMAKNKGRNLVLEYDEKETKVLEWHKDIYWVPLIRKALLEKHFFLVFQPVVDLINGDISYYEVLIRMRGQKDEVIYPVEFIPVAERMGLIHSIDLWVVDSAIAFLAELPAKMSALSLSINLSSMAFQDTALLPSIKEKLERTRVDAKRITFEITETAAVENFQQTREMISEIRGLGCKFALDDFGAGFCSFNYLKTFPVDYVKIDGQFIQNLINDETDQILVKSMIEIATNLGKKTIAEFVETPETIQKLQEMGVNFGQGYAFGEPKIDLLSVDTLSLGNIVKQAYNTGEYFEEPLIN